MDQSLHELWPPFGLRVVTPRLELRVPTDNEIPALMNAARDIHAEGDPMPFLSDWSRLPDPEFIHGGLQFHWRSRADFTAADWHLPFAAFVDGEPVGTQGVRAINFADLRTVNTGSWLQRSHQGQGLGVEMRQAVLHFAFVGLGAVTAASEARVGNESSAGVSRRIGYRDNGRVRTKFGDGAVVEEQRFRLDRDDWAAQQRDDIELHGIDAFLPMLKLDDS